MADVECQRRLMKLAALERNAGGFAAKRMPAIGADDEPRRYRSTARSSIATRSSPGLTAMASSSSRVRLGIAAARCFQRRHQNAVLNIISEHIETDFVAGKLDLRRTDQAPGVVDQPHGQKFGRLVLTSAAIHPAFARNRPRRRAGPSSGCRHRASAGQSILYARPIARSRSRRTTRPVRHHHGNVIDRGIPVHTQDI